MRRGSVRGLAGMLTVLLVAACGPVPEQIIEPEVSVVDIQLVEGTLFEQRMDLILRIRNPNDFDLALDGMRFDLEVNDRSFVRGLSDEPVVVPRLGERVIYVPATTTLIEMVNQMILLSQRGTIDYRIVGEVILASYGRVAVPFEKRGTFGPLLMPGPGRRPLQPGVRT